MGGIDQGTADRIRQGATNILKQMCLASPPSTATPGSSNITLGASARDASYQPASDDEGEAGGEGEEGDDFEGFSGLELQGSLQGDAGLQGSVGLQGGCSASQDDAGPSSKPSGTSSSSSSKSSNGPSAPATRMVQQQRQRSFSEAWTSQMLKDGLVGALVALAYPDRIAR